MFEANVFAARLRSARKSRGLSQRELAESLYLSTQAISKWELGESVPDIAHICSLASLLGLSVDNLLGVESTAERALIAIDGGGSKTECVLISLQGRVLRRLVLPGSNPNACTVAGCCEILRRGVDELLRENYRVAALFVGGAGMASGGNGKAVEASLAKAYPQLILRCRGDIVNLLAQTDDPDNAIAVISGTGCVVYASQEGKLQRFGGGGWRLETLGSGYDIGRAALLAALEHRDGTGAETALTEAVERQLGGKVWDHVAKLSGETNAYIASFAPPVLEAWQHKDPVATAIVQENLQRIAHLVKTAASQAPKAQQVILGGSLLTQSKPFQNALKALLPRQLRVETVAYPPIWGACLQSAKIAGLPAPDPNLFMDSYKED